MASKLMLVDFYLYNVFLFDGFVGLLVLMYILVCSCLFSQVADRCVFVLV
jgi:hypothetical protein